MKHKTVMFAFCIFACILLFAGCTQKYDFKHAFFPLVADTSEEETDSQYESWETSDENKEIVYSNLNSIMNFINEEFNLDISKPMPEVKNYSNSWGAAASYRDGVIYMTLDKAEEYKQYNVIHELIHYLSDNDGDVGFVHENTFWGKPVYVGFGLTEGLTEVITVMYCEEYNIPIPPEVIDGEDTYSLNQKIAQTYYMVEPEVVRWMLISDYKSMADFVKTNLSKVANIPQQYLEEELFDYHFYGCQDGLENYMTGATNDEELFRAVYTASVEIAAITARASGDETLKNRICDEVFTGDDRDIIKQLVFG